MRKLVFVALALGAASQFAGASKKCGNSYIADNKVCHVGTSTPYVPPASAPYVLPSGSPAPAAPVAAPAYVSPLTRFGSCQEARAAGWSNIPSSSANYAPGLDRDKDGVACEAGGKDDDPSGPRAAILGTRPAGAPTCAALPNEPDADALAQARPVRVFDVQGYAYVLAREFACANGFFFRDDVGVLTITSPARKLIVVGRDLSLNSQFVRLSMNSLTLENEAALPYADLLSAFRLTVEGQKIEAVQVAPLPGQQP